MGSRSSGKSTLLNRFLYPSRVRDACAVQAHAHVWHASTDANWLLVQVEVPKPSEGLEYTYARKPSNFDHEKKDLAHIWEVGGSPEFAEEIAQGEQIFLNVKQARVLACVCVCVCVCLGGGCLGSVGLQDVR